MIPLLLGLACAPPPAAAEPVFVRGGVLLPEADGSLGFQELAWEPGTQITVAGQPTAAPHQPECRAIASVDLGDVTRLVVSGGPAPDTALAFSPDGRWLAVGSYLGDVLVVDGWTGAVRARRHLSESLAKVVAWSPDGGTLYAGEQSPDALLHAMDPADLSDRWTLRLADEVGTSTAPAGADLFGVYDLPGVFGVEVLGDGDLIVTATHGWTDDGVRRNRSRLLRLRPDGEQVAAWPAGGPADAVFKRPSLDEDGGLLVASVPRSADGPPPDNLPVGGIQVLTADLEPVVGVPLAPLAPWYQRAYVLEALDVSRSAGRLFAGLGDGRVHLYDLEGHLVRAVDPGVPVLAGDVPVASPVGWGAFAGDEVVVITSESTIPWGAASPELRPPTAHPRANSLLVVDAAGEVRWSWSGSQALGGLALDGDVAYVGAGARSADRRRDLYGVVVLDLAREELLTVCPTEGPVFFRLAAHDGRVAVAEYPVEEPDGSFTGAYRVTVLR